MPEKEKTSRLISASELKKTIATSLGTAFGIVIGMIWTNVVLSGFATGGVNLTSAGGTWSGWGVFVVTASIVTVICVVLIMLIGRWGNK